MLGRHDLARTAYTEARTLFRAVEDRLGEANVLSRDWVTWRACSDATTKQERTTTKPPMCMKRSAWKIMGEPLSNLPKLWTVKNKR